MPRATARGPKGHSRKTRIETEQLVPEGVTWTLVPKAIPEKQGLKLDGVGTAGQYSVVPKAIPEKQGVKLEERNRP